MRSVESSTRTRSFAGVSKNTVLGGHESVHGYLVRDALHGLADLLRWPEPDPLVRRQGFIWMACTWHDPG